MSAEKFCPTHGPFDARYATCPYCQGSRGRPPAPAPLEEQMRWAGDAQAEDLSTAAPLSVRRSAPMDDDDLTQMPRLRRRPIEGDDLDETQVERQQVGLLGWLVVKNGMRRGTFHRLSHDTTVGRRNADIVLQDPKISKTHAKFGVQNDCFVVVDLLSENGTYVNGGRISQVTPLHENDEIRVGDTLLVLKTLEP